VCGSLEQPVSSQMPSRLSLGVKRYLIHLFIKAVFLCIKGGVGLDGVVSRCFCVRQVIPSYLLHLSSWVIYFRCIYVVFMSICVAYWSLVSLYLTIFLNGWSCWVGADIVLVKFPVIL
jgi:hypothetical protein